MPRTMRCRRTSSRLTRKRPLRDDHDFPPSVNRGPALLALVFRYAARVRRARRNSSAMADTPIVHHDAPLRAEGPMLQPLPVDGGGSEPSSEPATPTAPAVVTAPAPAALLAEPDEPGVPPLALFEPLEPAAPFTAPAPPEPSGTAPVAPSASSAVSESTA